jgi:hypothetical protein
MTSSGCQECPSEEIILPLRNAAIALAIFVLSLFWFSYSWSPFFPSLGTDVSRLLICMYKFSESKLSGKTKEVSAFILKSMASIQKLRPLQYFKIFVSYLQVVSSFLGFHVAWPSSIVSAMIWCKVIFNFNLLALPGVSCLWKGLGYNSKLMIYTLIPLVIGFLLWMPVLLTSIMKYTKLHSIEQNRFNNICAIVRDRFWNAIMFMCFMVLCQFPCFFLT